MTLTLQSGVACNLTLQQTDLVGTHIDERATVIVMHLNLYVQAFIACIVEQHTCPFLLRASEGCSKFNPGDDCNK